MKRTKTKALALLFVAGVTLSACCSGEDDYMGDVTVVTPPTPDPAPEETSVLPSDAQAGTAPVVETPTAQVPNPTVMPDEYQGEAVMRIHMDGIQIPGTYEWMRLYGSGARGQNIWVDLDGSPKGIVVVNNADNEDGSVVAQTDIVFLVDNSGSMGEEANAIANEIIEWSQLLANSGLDVRFGCVGYGEGPITGGINLTNVDAFHDFLSNRRGYTSGTYRTEGWAGSDAAALSAAAADYNNGSWGECGAAALRFADDKYSFRTTASHVFINFTDEPNQPNYKPGLSVSWVEDANNWPASKGVIHTVYSDPYTKNFTETELYNEHPWRMSTATGGTIMYTRSDFSDASLETLTVTGALQNTYTIYFGNIDAYKDGQTHYLTITIKSEDGQVQAQKTIPVVFE